MRRPFTFAVLTALILSTACITVNVPIGGEPESAATVWTVEPEKPDPWTVSTEYIVHIKDFTSAQASQGVQMTVIQQDGTINRSSADIWTSRPVELLPDILLRDMVTAEAWGAVLRKSTMLPEDIIVEGFVREFGGRVTGERWEAVLDVDVTALDGDTYQLMFQENYRFHWELDQPSYAELADAMNTLVQIWTEEVMGDIWSATLPVR
ncbi:MAG: hypothetical protein GF388_04085 [Candidatus Aegiribacteria sp.]|nr:hypothetical protein [Candidatus Aegiribacteria sp.]MBD3294419.1 hypothetical protein [Candidatus Fermentibacteria bacterium]